MGWSCATAASKTADRWDRACRAQTGSSNVFQAGGTKYFWEMDRVEHPDGAITGELNQFVGKNSCRQVGTFRIEGDGTVSSAPAVLKDLK